MYSDSQKDFGAKSQCKIFHGGTLRGGPLNSEKPVRGILLPSMYGFTQKNLTLTFCPRFFPDFPTHIVTPKTILRQKPDVKFFRVAPYVEVTSKMGFLKRDKK